jgi:Na+/H+ antiporter NhaD/arsenite permease-like protein
MFSQVLSNVPAAILLSGFTEDFSSLLIGTNVGGLGTLIASMASLISYKLYAQHERADKGQYLLVFTGYNVVGLVILLMFCQLVLM